MDIEEELDAFHLENGFDRTPDGKFIEIPPYSREEAKAAAAARAAAARAQWCRNAGVEPVKSETPKTPPKVAKSSRATGDSDRTRERIRTAAERLFQQRAFETVGVRQIAAEAKVDQALLHRYFGSKEKLFEEIVSAAFVIDEGLDVDETDFAEMLVSSAVAPTEGFDAHQLLLRSLGSPATIGRVATAFHEQFVEPLATMLEGPDAELRATLVAAHVLGLYVVKHAMRLPALTDDTHARAVAHAAAAVRACLSPPAEGEKLGLAAGSEGEVHEGVGVLLAEAMIDEGERDVEDGLE